MIKDTIPVWPPYLLTVFNDRIKRKGSATLYVSNEYWYSLHGPWGSDRYYFRIKLKTTRREASNDGTN